MLDVGAIGDAAIVRINEEIDFVSAPRLEHVLKAVEQSSSGRIVLSLESCPYCDSTCLGIVLRAVQRIGPRIGVVVPPGTVARRLFEISGIASQPFVFGSLDDALTAAI
jgi:anti-anti-sigma factor